MCPSSRHSASCFVAPHDNRSNPQIVLALSSQLIRDFTPTGLRFVIGHEFGHAAYNHHGYPDPSAADSDSERTFLLELRRSAEFSADRVGLLAAGSPSSAMRACIQLACGLPADYLCEDAERHFLDQVEEIGRFSSPSSLEDASHPPLPVRALNLNLFARSSYCSGPGRTTGGKALAMEDIDSRLYEALGRLRGGTGATSATQCADLATFWAVVALFASDNRYSTVEQEWLSLRFGKRRGAGALRFMSQNGKESAERALHRFRCYCPHVKDARLILKGTVARVLEEAASIAGFDHPMTSKTLSACMRVLRNSG